MHIFKCDYRFNLMVSLLLAVTGYGALIAIEYDRMLSKGIQRFSIPGNSYIIMNEEQNENNEPRDDFVVFTFISYSSRIIGVVRAVILPQRTPPPITYDYLRTTNTLYNNDRIKEFVFSCDNGWFPVLIGVGCPVNGFWIEKRHVPYTASDLHNIPISSISINYLGNIINILCQWIMWTIALCSVGIVRRSMRRARNMCASCGYSLYGLSGAQCPECGAVGVGNSIRVIEREK